mgnify:CR=1 FL=1
MASDKNIYRDIAKRTNGDIYIGVVGPVRTGKSTFIKKFMEVAVLPAIRDEYDRQRAVDETPQSASGKTVTTTEPKFVPDEAVTVSLDGSTVMRVRLVDCVGYIVPGALGTTENDAPRMVHTPWAEEPLPFAEAAEIGTRKVIREHSTIGILVTTDGTIGEIPRSDYEEAEARVAAELSAAEKPYAIILNSAHPENESAVSLAYELEHKYGAPVALVNCTELNSDDIGEIFGMLLREFPITELRFDLPVWTRTLEKGHWLRESLLNSIGEISDNIRKMGDLQNALLLAGSNDCIEKWELSEAAADTGIATVNVVPKADLYYRIISELTGLDVKDDAALVSLLLSLSRTKKAYDKICDALNDAEEKGYGIVMPSPGDLSLSEPEIVKQAGGYGVKLHASAKSIHMIRANIETEISPMVGSEQQSEELVKYMLSEFEENPDELWNSNMFGKSLYELVNEGLHTKLEHMPEDARQRLSETLERIINEGSNGLICILL